MRENTVLLEGEKWWKKNKKDQMNIPLCRRNAATYTHFTHTLYSTIYSCGLTHRSCMSFFWCTHPKHIEEKWNPFWLKLKFIVNQSSGISEMQVHACTQIHLSFPHTLKITHACIPHVYPFCPPPCRWWSVWTAGKRTSVILNVVFHHITVKVSTGDWWWITSQPVLWVFPQPVTYSNSEPSPPSLLH